MLTPRENALIAYRHGQPEWIPFSFLDFNTFFANPSMERYMGFESGPDAFGVSWTYEPTVRACMTTPGAEQVLKNIAEWREVVRFPDLEAVDWAKQAEKDLVGRDGKKLDVKGNGKLWLCMVINGSFERLHALMGMQEALISLITDPESCYDFFGAMADYKIAYYKKIVQYYPVDVINGHDDFGTNDRMFMSPDMWRSLLKPHLKRISDACHEMGVIYQHHSCGYIEPIIGDLAEIGIDAIDTLQACNTHLGELKARYGDKLTFCGGFNTNGVLDMYSSTPNQIKAEYRRVIDLLAPGGSYIVYPITATVRYAEPFTQEHLSYGVNFYKRQEDTSKKNTINA